MKMRFINMPWCSVLYTRNEPSTYMRPTKNPKDSSSATGTLGTSKQHLAPAQPSYERDEL